MKATGQGAPEQAQSVKPRSRSGLTLLVAFLLSAIITVVAGRVYFEDQRAAIIAQKSAELSSIRDLKTDEIARWRQDLFGDVRQAAAGPTLPNDVGAWLADPEDARPAAILREWLRGICQVQGYAGALILTPDGSRWVSTAEGRDPDARDRLEAQDAAVSAEATVTDLFLDPVDGRPRVDAVAPLRGDATRTAAVLVFHHDPNTDLYPMVRGWPAPSGTSETLLIRRSGDGILYLNELRYRDATALKLSFPRSRADLPGVQALAGGPRVVEGVDYRGVPVLAAVGPVAGTTWYVVAKVDASEAYGGVSDRQRMTVAGVVLLILVLALAFSLAWRQRTAAAGRKEVVAEQAAGLMAEQYDYLTRYANDVVLLVDEDLRILQANDRATAVYGYTRGELLTMTLADLHDPAFHERARQEFDLAKREGSRVFEARHVRKDGSLTDMEVSARTIDSGDRTLYLAVERDITERKAAETRLRTLSLRHEAILGAIPEIIAEVDADGI
ncbi:MAG TPA: PAS domain S-box protein, partial [Coriobacteriia bacterium]